MNHNTQRHRQIALLVVAASMLAAPMAPADVVTEWNIKAGEIVVEAKLGPSPANRVLAIVHMAVYEAANAIHHRGGLRADGHPGGLAVGAAQAMGDDEPRPVPPRSTAKTHECVVGA